MHQVEAYTATGIASGVVSAAGEAWIGPSEGGPILVERAIWYPIEGGPPERRERVELLEDEVLVLAVERTDVSVHAVWHSIVLDAGPYRVSAELPTPPGFDPGRALTRPGGSFVALRDVRIEIAGRPGTGMVERPWAFVNRYAVDRVAADMILGFFFPGAHFETEQGVPAA